MTDTITADMKKLITRGWQFSFIDGHGWKVIDPIGDEFLDDRGLPWLDLREAVEAAEFVEEQSVI